MAREFKTTEDVIAAGKEKKLITIRGGRITYEGTKEKKTYQFTDPEEPVRARVYVELIDKYKYPANRIEMEVYPPSRAPPYPADVVVYEDDEHEKVFIVVEAKADSSERNIEIAKREGLGNANLLNTKYLLLVCGEEELSYDVSSKPSLSSLEKHIISQIPPKYGKLPKYKFKKEREKSFFDLRYASLNELNNKFQRCHNEIWEGGKRDPAVSFDEMSKLMFSKIYDERFTVFGDYYKYQIGSHESPSVIAERAKELYKEAQRNEPDVFKAPIELSDDMVFRIVEILQDISLAKTDLDSKGRAFEKFLGKFFRGEYGQYFTPRQIVEFMVKMLAPNARDLVIDPACGSGGFLLYSLNLVRERVNKDYEGDQDTIKDIIWRFANKQIFGIEINDRIARVAMMDMVIHEDGHSNIECANALQHFEDFDPRRDIKPNKYDFVFTNPPFGAVEKDQKILELYELGSKNRKRKSQKTEILFIERCLNLLRIGGKMGIVLPDGILTNSSLKYVRDFIEANARILAVVSLPQQTFVPSGSGVKASLLFLQKKREGEEFGDYPIFMVIAEHVGYDATGRSDKNDFPNVLEDWRRFKDDKRDFSNAPRAFAVMRGELEGRIDPRYYKPSYLSIISEIEGKCELKTLKEISASINSGATPLAKGDAYVEKDRGIPFIRSGDLTEENIINYDEVLHLKREIHDKALKRSKLRKNDLLIAIVGATIGKVSIFTDEREANINQAIACVRLKEETVNPFYVLHFLRNKFGQVQLDRLKRPVARANINLEEVGEIKIPIPSRPIQGRIAKIMDEAYKRRKEQLKVAEDLLAGINDFVLDKLGIEIPEVEEKKSFVVTLKDLKEGKRHDVFYYQPKFKKLMEAVENNKYEVGELEGVIGDFIKGNLPKHEDKGGETKILQIRNITLNGDFDLTDILTAKSSSVPRNTKLKKGELIFVITGATIGKVAVFDLDEEVYLGGDMVKTDVKNANPLYLLSVLLSPIGQMQINQHVTGATNKHLSPEEIKSIKIPLPPIEIQNEIAEEIKGRRELAKEMRKEAEEVIKLAKEKVEKMILGEENDRNIRIRY
ncbi:Type-1 restriction enzyme MjaXIP specificity protein [ANME-1 cluster archaeon GoMg2]|nr:Type-1 restriction enzyme MjaXIP specificity protein [ANME-1 cluster archaeon GoMg2]